MAGRGRPPGQPKTGGRKSGTPNKATTERRLALVIAQRELAESLTPRELLTITPKEVMLRIMRAAVKAGNGPLALAAAEKAAPYCHARLSNVEMNATVRRSASDFTDEELAALAADAGSDEREGGIGEATGLPN